MDHGVNLSKPKIIFAAPNTIERVHKVASVNSFIKNVVVFGGGGERASKMPGNVMEFAQFLEKSSPKSIGEFVSAGQDTRRNVSLILCSSGTTGMPKGVQLTQRNVSLGVAQHL